MNSNHFNTSSRSIELLEVSLNGKFQACDKNDENSNLQNTLFSLFYPKGHVARLSLRSMHWLRTPAVLDEVFSGMHWKGVGYLPVGSRKSIEKQEIYLVDKVTYDAIARRFRGCNEALISQFDLLILPCDILIEHPHLRLLVVPNEIPGINDWRGWIRRSLFSTFALPAGRPRYEFVMAFADLQAKGEFAPMDDAVADRHNADIIIPKKCLKPNSTPGFGSGNGRFFGRIVLGIKKNPLEELSSEGIKSLLDDHVCRPGCNPITSQAMRHAVARAFQV